VTLTRRELLIASMAMACARAMRAKTEPLPDVSLTSSSIDAALGCTPVLLDWRMSGISTHAAILTPPTTPTTTVVGRYPVLVALHGRGEAVKGPELGAMGWPNDYALQRALERVCAPPLTHDDFEGLVTDAHLQELNTELAAKPWSGLVVVCPYLPDLDLRRDSDVVDYGRFLADTLLPRVHRELPTMPSAVGIDGVSLGGAVALRAGMRMPETFAAVGALQPAIDWARTSDLVDLARAARAKRPSLALRITTSQEDYYRDVTRALSTAWRQADVGHDFGELPGPHDYVFNRGAGGYEMITWQRRALA
jgi:hypothetical protein